MNTEGSISSFFYNLIPGVLFIFGALFLIDKLFCVLSLFKDNDGLAILITVVIGLFIGFVLQGMAKWHWLRKMFDISSRQKVLDDNKDNYLQVVKEVSEEMSLDFKNLKKRH